MKIIVVVIAVYNFCSSGDAVRFFFVVCAGLGLSSTLDRVMSVSIVPLANDDLDPGEETSLPGQRIIKDPVHGFRGSPSSPPPTTLMTSDSYDAYS